MASDSTTNFYEVHIVKSAGLNQDKDQKDENIYHDVTSVSAIPESSIQPMGITESTRETGKRSKSLVYRILNDSRLTKILKRNSLHIPA